MSITDHDLESYLDEALPAEEMTRIEQRLRKEPRLLSKLAAINGRRDAGVHTLGEIWRRNRLTCLSRETLGAYLLGTLPKAQAQYVPFHLDVIGCRYCQANFSDLSNQQSESASNTQSRRQRYFQSSAGYLKNV